MARGTRPKSDKALNNALRDIERGASIREAASKRGIGRERLSRAVVSSGMGRPEARQKFVPVRTRSEARNARSRERMNKAIGELEQGASLRESSRKFHVSRTRLTTRAKELELVGEHVPGKRIEIVAAAKREMTTYSDGSIDTVRLSFGEASRNSYYLHTVYKALHGDLDAQRALQNMADSDYPEGVIDVYGVFHPWETDINVIRRLTMGGNVPEIYRLV